MYQATICSNTSGDELDSLIVRPVRSMATIFKLRTRTRTACTVESGDTNDDGDYDNDGDLYIYHLHGNQRLYNGAARLAIDTWGGVGGGGEKCF